MGYNAWVLVLLVVLGILLAVTPAVAQRDGAGKRGEVGAVFRQSLWLALFLGVVLCVALRCSGPLLRAVGVFDVFRLPDGRRSVAWRLTFQADDRTLTDDEINALREALVRALTARFRITLRGQA